ncbi:cofactor-independent phosphoglycerate mutase [Desulforhopalus singaporensis]|uniref:Phosphoglycerate mutase n=1 Tax=Desulforhopalus singaporensis TaxID=91360 RepID=A0A1H0K511_9BACT|nr:cofactor-independent phosphoglycerate mutase [Desulforhopalus singaporensis]SDO50751.1 phosphoglycerate mutase [Desulforhopalus singaporensis]
MKYLILVGDGMGDYPIEEIGGLTPLAKAHIPTIDRLCERGELFLNRTIPEGYPPGSDVANMSLMGYDPAAYYTGRAPLEAAAMGIRLAPDEIAFRCNMVTLDKQTEDRVVMTDFSAGHITSEESRQLIEDLENHCSSEAFHFKAGVSYRNLVVYKGQHPGFAPVPPHDFIERDVTSHYQAYFNDPEWRKVLTGAQELLAAHPVNLKRIDEGKNPANFIWLWGEGKMASAPTLGQRFGITGSMISAVDLLKGLGVLAGITALNIPGATGYIDTNYDGKAQGAIDALKNEDFVFVHLEGPDEAGHKGSLVDKIQAIEDFDGRIVRPIIDFLHESKEDFRVVVTMDHFTPLALRTHASDPVPTILYDSRENIAGSGKTFSEENCRQLQDLSGEEIMQGHTLIEKLLQQRQ